MSERAGLRAAPTLRPMRLSRVRCAALVAGAFMQIDIICKTTTLQALRTALRRCDSRTRLDELYRSLSGHFRVRPTVRRRGAKD